MRPPLPPLLALALAAACASAPASPDDPGVRTRAQRSGTEASLRGVCAVDPRTCWASGSGGTWLRTTDGGETWQTGVVPGCERLDFRDVAALDADTAVLVAVGDPAEFWRTEDAGESWTRVHHDATPGVFFDAVAFWDDRRGMAFSDPAGGAFVVLETEDGGRRWRRVPPERLPAPVQGEAGFAASGTCLAVARPASVWIGTGGSAARVLHSDDGGARWSVAEVPLAQGRPSQGVFSLVVLPSGFGVAVGGDYEVPARTDGTAAYTRDGGRSWTHTPGVGPGYRSCVAVVPGDEPVFVAVGKEGASAFRGFDPRWRSVEELAGHYALSFSPTVRGRRARGWAVGAQGRVTRVEVPLR